MTIQLLCDLCRQPKETVEHLQLFGWDPRTDTQASKRRYRGNIDLCRDCVEKTTHGGQDSAHKHLSRKRRLELGVTRR